MKRKDVDEVEKIIGQLEGLHGEMSTMAKKSPNDGVNTFKLNFVNATLNRCNAILGAQYKPFEDFNSFNSDDVPSNSDVTFMLTQYLNAIEKFRSDNIIQEHGYWYWKITDGTAPVRTSLPKKLSE
jgi:hypothetical protein